MTAADDFDRIVLADAHATGDPSVFLDAIVGLMAPDADDERVRALYELVREIEG